MKGKGENEASTRKTGGSRSWGLSCPKDQQKTLLVRRGHGIFLLRSAGELQQANKYYLQIGWGHQGDRATVCRDAGCVYGVGVFYKQHGGQGGMEESLMPSGIALAA